MNTNNTTFPLYINRNDNNPYTYLNKSFIENIRFKLGIGIDNLEVRIFYNY